MSTAASPPASKPLIVIMGVSGSGKSSVGELLAERLGVPFIEGDKLHPKANIEKMSAGTPLDDEDRWPWLDIIGEKLVAARNTGAILSCSALKKIYRDRLRNAVGNDLTFVYLDGSRDLLMERLTDRPGHFFKPALLDSQLETLEKPQDEPRTLTVDVTPPQEEIVEDIVETLKKLAR